jgi:hypothetical protein
MRQGFVESRAKRSSAGEAPRQLLEKRRVLRIAAAEHHQGEVTLLE